MMKNVITPILQKKGFFKDGGIIQLKGSELSQGLYELASEVGDRKISKKLERSASLIPEGAVVVAESKGDGYVYSIRDKNNNDITKEVDLSILKGNPLTGAKKFFDTQQAVTGAAINYLLKQKEQLADEKQKIQQKQTKQNDDKGDRVKVKSAGDFLDESFQNVDTETEELQDEEDSESPDTNTQKQEPAAKSPRKQPSEDPSGVKSDDIFVPVGDIKDENKEEEEEEEEKSKDPEIDISEEIETLDDGVLKTVNQQLNEDVQNLLKKYNSDSSASLFASLSGSPTATTKGQPIYQTNVTPSPQHFTAGDNIKSTLETLIDQKNQVNYRLKQYHEQINEKFRVRTQDIREKLQQVRIALKRAELAGRDDETVENLKIQKNMLDNDLKLERHLMEKDYSEEINKAEEKAKQFSKDLMDIIKLYKWQLKDLSEQKKKGPVTYENPAGPITNFNNLFYTPDYQSSKKKTGAMDKKEKVDTPDSKKGKKVSGKDVSTESVVPNPVVMDKQFSVPGLEENIELNTSESEVPDQYTYDLDNEEDRGALIEAEKESPGIVDRMYKRGNIKFGDTDKQLNNEDALRTAQGSVMDLLDKQQKRASASSNAEFAIKMGAIGAHMLNKADVPYRTPTHGLGKNKTIIPNWDEKQKRLDYTVERLAGLLKQTPETSDASSKLLANLSTNAQLKDAFRQSLMNEIQRFRQEKQLKVQQERADQKVRDNMIAQARRFENIADQSNAQVDTRAIGAAVDSVSRTMSDFMQHREIEGQPLIAKNGAVMVRKKGGKVIDFSDIEEQQLEAIETYYKQARKEKEAKIKAYQQKQNNMVQRQQQSKTPSVLGGIDYSNT